MKELEPDRNWKKVYDQPVTSREILTIGGRELELTNLEQPLWPGVLKADLLKYYIDISGTLLPHLQHRPLRSDFKKHPHDRGERINDMNKSHPGNRIPDFLDVFTTKRLKPVPGKRDYIDYPVCNNLESLVWLVNMGSIDLNPWFSVTSHIDQPDYLVIDLDPTAKDRPFSEVVMVAEAFRKLFRQLKITSFPKTSGKTGMHLYIPLGAQYTFEEVKPFARRLAERIHEDLPGLTTLEHSIDRRGEKIYIDYIQGSNKYRSVASVYSVRPGKLPVVSTPLSWNEVKPSLDPGKFDLVTAKKRLHQKGDLFAGVLEAGIRLDEVSGRM